MPTKKKGHSLKSNAGRSEGSSFKDAPSRKSVVKKSRNGNEENVKLRVATPSNLGWLAQAGLIVPDDLDPAEENIPLDFTRLSNREVGAVHSRFAVRHSHALYVRASYASEILVLRRKHRLGLAAFRIRHGDKYRTDKACTEAFSLDKKVGKKIERELNELEIRVAVLDAVIGGFEDVVKAASREMSRRDSERAPHD